MFAKKLIRIGLVGMAAPVICIGIETLLDEIRYRIISKQIREDTVKRISALNYEMKTDPTID